MLISVDAGYGFTKVEPGGIVFPSTIGKGRDLNLVSDKIDCMKVEVNGEEYFVGDLARKECFDVSLSFEKNKIKNNNTIILVLAGIVNCISKIGGWVNIDLVTGLPIEYLKQKNEFIEILQNKVFEVRWMGVKYVIRINSVGVFPQSAGALFNEILDENGDVRNKNLMLKKICMIDVGFKTTDFVVLDKMKYVDKESGTIELGINCALKMIKTDLMLYEIEYDDRLTEEVNKYKEIIAKSLLNNLYLRLPKLDEYFVVYISGGGGFWLSKVFKKGILVNKPQRANALGFLKVGRLRSENFS